MEGAPETHREKSGYGLRREVLSPVETEKKWHGGGRRLRRRKSGRM